ncbi:MAG: M48 family metallopeptidase [Proteobacteria bacterium]|nr:M48 family metallopeptidase [Pseudomonadota bacterium]
MNFIAVVIIIALFSDYFLHAVADYLNIRSLKKELPQSFKGLYDDQRYAESQEYLRVNTRFGIVSATFNLVVLLIFWFGKGFPYLDHWARSWHTGPVITGLIYIGSLLLLKGILSLPFSIYSTFVIEERFGFNKTTWRTFGADLLKGLVLSAILGGIVIALVMSFFEYFGKNGWWYCWIALTILLLILQYIVPTWIMPLFNKFKPLEDGSLKTAIMDYARSIQFSLDNIFVMDGSKRSSKSNAFFTGFGKNKRIVLFDTLIEKHSIDELVSVLAHEMGHYKKKHILKMMIISICHSGFLLFLISRFISYEPLFQAFFMTQVSIYAGLIFFGMLYAPIDFFLGILLQGFSRKNEYEADRFSAATSKKPLALGQALKKLAVDNLSNLTPHPLYVYLHYSHPPILKRVAEIEKMTI